MLIAAWNPATRVALGSLLCLTLMGRAASAEPPEFRWGGDAEGGAPFVEADPTDPSKLRGFDVEIGEAIARKLGRKARFVQVAFSAIDASVARGDFEIGLSGVEETPARRAALAVTIPYFEFREVLTVRAADGSRFRTLSELAGRRVGTLGGTIAYDLLMSAAKTNGIIPVSYDDDVHPYDDLLAGRLDAVLLDHIIAARSSRRRQGLFTQPEPVASGRYVGVLAKGSPLLADVDRILRELMRDGTLEATFRRFGVWDEGQRVLFSHVLSGGSPSQGAAEPARVPTLTEATLTYLPALLRAALVTLVLSCAAMLLAVGAGTLIATGRVYGGPVTRGILLFCVEVTRGTPVLLQLFVIYYGLAPILRLDAAVAALLGLGLNYAAYESEIYRSALESVGKGQLEAARTLGLTEMQILWLVRGPQAFRIALAPMTNDFVALLKDSSLVSVITVVELTKQTSIFAANVGSWAVPGALCALLYLALSFPLARLARMLEDRWRSPSP